MPLPTIILTTSLSRFTTTTTTTNRCVWSPPVAAVCQCGASHCPPSHASLQDHNKIIPSLKLLQLANISQSFSLHLRLIQFSVLLSSWPMQWSWFVFMEIRLSSVVAPCQDFCWSILTTLRMSATFRIFSNMKRYFLRNLRPQAQQITKSGRINI